MNVWHSDEFLRKQIEKPPAQGPFRNGKFIDKERYNEYHRKWKKAHYKTKRRPLLTTEEGINCLRCEILLSSKLAQGGDGIRCGPCLTKYDRDRRSTTEAPRQKLENEPSLQDKD